MKKIILLTSAFYLLFSLNSAVFAVCTEGSSWTAIWTDSRGETTYNLEAPCKVYIGVPFSIVATVTDNTYPNYNVAYNWSLLDNGGLIAGGSWNWLRTVSGQWQKVVERTYTGNPVDHTIEFRFIDLGSGGGHGWTSNLIGNVTVDPYPPTVNSSPVVDAGPDLFLKGDDQKTAVIAGTASDADGNTLSYRWLEDGSVLQAVKSVDISGAATLFLADLQPLSIGAHTLTLEVTDGAATVTDDMSLVIENSPPIAAPAGGGTFQVGESISLRGSVADFDGDQLVYQWKEGSTMFATGGIVSVSGGAPVSLPETLLAGGLSLGIHILTLEVSDGTSIVTETCLVTVIDTIAPTLAPSVSANILWPPNHKMSEVLIRANAHDNSGGTITLSIVITDNQPGHKNNKKSGLSNCSIERFDQAMGVIALQLRAERSGKGGDHLYTITISAQDESGNSSSADVIVKVPHDMGRL